MMDRVKDVLDKWEDVDTDDESTELWCEVCTSRFDGEGAVRRVVEEWAKKAGMSNQAYRMWSELYVAVNPTQPAVPQPSRDDALAAIGAAVVAVLTLALQQAAASIDAVDTGDQDDAS